MYKISSQQIKAPIQTFYQCNAPVQVYDGVQKMLKGLEEIKVEEKKPEPTV